MYMCDQSFTLISIIAFKLHCGMCLNKGLCTNKKPNNYWTVQAITLKSKQWILWKNDYESSFEDNI